MSPHARAQASAPTNKLLRCPYCHEVTDEASAVCAGCLARHHASCWYENGRCASCRGTLALSKHEPEPARTDWLTPALRVLCVVLAGLLWLRDPLAPVVEACDHPAAPVCDHPPAAIADPPVRDSPGPQGPAPQSVRAGERAALWALQRGEWQVALDALSDLPNDADPELFVLRARALHGLGLGKHAVADLDVALRALPEAHAWRLARADLRAELGDLPAAIADYRAVLSAQPGNARAAFRAAWLSACWEGNEPLRRRHLLRALEIAQAERWAEETLFIEAALGRRRGLRAIWGRGGLW